ncbi:hypothetical protein [Thermomonas sp.]|uniref:flagellar basal body rod protein FlgB n=1 Tax=Thermomonas sp. TaxID=1971895 RepID=UPI002BB982E7|nr:hypothetical protein [Thermomonas sp.]HRO63595.1 hypothetical protein [Thermomonas sp.]
MSNDLTIDALRLALGMQQLRAETAARNIAHANMPGARAERLDFGASQSLLARAAKPGADLESGLRQMLATAAADLPRAETVDGAGGEIRVDEQVADAASANLDYQALSEALSRRFGLMRLAIAGKN